MMSRWYRKSGYYERELVKSIGSVILKIVKLHKDGRIASPLLDVLGITKQKYSRELKVMLADIAYVASYDGNQ